MSYGANQTMCCEVEPEEKWTGRPRRAKAKRPQVLDKVVPIYEHDGSRLPDAVRVALRTGARRCTTSTWISHTRRAWRASPSSGSGITDTSINR